MGKRAWSGIVTFLVLSIAGTGCISSGMKDEKVFRKYSEEAAALETRSAGDIVASLQGKIQGAYSDELNIYAPKHLVAAEHALDQAVTYHSGADMSNATREAIFAEKMIASGYVVKQNVKRVLKRVFDKQERLKSLDVPALMSVQYDSLKKKIMESVVSVEEGSMESAMKDEATLLEAMRQLEVQAVKHIALKKAEEALAIAISEGAKKMAPKSFQRATDAIEKVRVFIEGSPQADTEARIKGEEAHHVALHALHTTREASSISALGKKDLWEEIVLEFEGHLSRMSQIVGAGSVTHMSLMDQVAAISAHVQQEQAAAEALASESVEPVMAETPEPPMVDNVKSVEIEVPRVESAEPIEMIVSSPEESEGLPVTTAIVNASPEKKEAGVSEASGEEKPVVTPAEPLPAKDADDEVNSASKTMAKSDNEIPSAGASIDSATAVTE